MKPGRIRVGVGGWSYAPWRGLFYPAGLAQARELEYASRRLTSIEINATFYSRFGRAQWAKWRDATPEDFVFAVKASRYCTQRKHLPDAKEAIQRFFGQGLSELGPKLGPINWQLPATKRFDAAEIAEFLEMLPREVEGIAVSHALEVRHASFAEPEFASLARDAGVAIVLDDSEKFPHFEERTADFTYARLMKSQARLKNGYAAPALDRWASQAQSWSVSGDVFVYFIAGAKERAPAAAEALLARVSSAPSRLRD